MDTATGEVTVYKSKKELAKAQVLNPNIQEIGRELYERLMPLSKEKRLDFFRDIAGPNKSKQRRVKRLAVKMAAQSRTRNRPHKPKVNHGRKKPGR